MPNRGFYAMGKIGSERRNVIEKFEKRRWGHTFNLDGVTIMAATIKSIAIIGGGPAGATLGNLLAKQGYQVGIFHTDKRPPLIVGESLLPAVVPMLRTLGLEEEVKGFSVHKPGATVCLGMAEVITGGFIGAAGRLPPYAYNTPRDLFDLALLMLPSERGQRLSASPPNCRRERRRTRSSCPPRRWKLREGFLTANRT